MAGFSDRYKQGHSLGGAAPSASPPGTFSARRKAAMNPPAPPSVDDNSPGFWDYPPMSLVAKPYQDIKDIAGEGLQDEFPYFKVPESVGKRAERTSQAHLNLAPFAMGGAAGAGGGALAKRVLGSSLASGGHDVAQQAMQTGEVDPGQAAIATGLGGVGQAGGELIGKGLSKLASRGVAPDIARLDPAKTQELVDASQRQGIQLTPAETTGLPSLMQQQKQLGNTMGAGDDLADFMRTRAKDQINPAVNRFLEGVSPVEGAEVAGDLTRAASKKAMSTVATNRAAQASPIYQKAFAEKAPVDVSGVIDTIDAKMIEFPEGGKVRAALTKARGFMQSSRGDLKLLHGSKLEIDDMLKPGHDSAVIGTAKRELQLVKTELLKAMDKASPDYASARSIFGDLSPGLERVYEGVTGTISKMKDVRLQAVAGKLFQQGQSPGPRAVAEARKQLQAADPDAWQAIKRAFLEEKWIKAGKQTLESQGQAPVNAGAKFRLELMGTEKQLDILKAALDPQELAAMDDLAKVLEATGRVKPIGSDTAWNIEANKVARNASSSVLSRILRMGSVDVLKDTAKLWDDANFISHSRELVDMITSPDGMSLLKELNQLSPSEEFSRAILGRAIVIGTGEQALDDGEEQGSSVDRFTSFLNEGKP